MLEWCTAHYWMTFWIIIFLLIIIDSIVCNISNTINNRHTIENNKIKLQFKELKNKDEENEKTV